MKTKNNSRETVDDQLRRSILRGSVLIFSMVLISLPIDARNFRTQFSNTGTDWKMKLLSVNQSIETTITYATFEQNAAGISKRFGNTSETFVSVPEQDEEIRIEAWMTNESYFNSAVYFDTAEADKALNLEDWMISNPLFNNLLADESAESDKPLEIEPWMLLVDN